MQIGSMVVHLGLLGCVLPAYVGGTAVLPGVEGLRCSQSCL